MPEPNFSESQLQAASNLAYADEIRQRTGQIPFPFVPSLPAEFLLGWDTAFDLDWIRYRLSGSFSRLHKGCNFFLQYKLSNLIDNPGRSKEWATWSKPYFRFQIPHKIKIDGRYRNDFHQWTRLKEIASTGVPTFYATNTMLEERELKELFESRQLLDRIALLDIAPVKRKHIHVSFSDPFYKFALHSTPEDAAFYSFSGTIERLTDIDKYSYADGIDQLIEIAEKIDETTHTSDTPGIREQLSQFQQIFTTYTGQRLGLPQLKRAILESFFARRFGLTVQWHPSIK